MQADKEKLVQYIRDRFYSPASTDYVALNNILNLIRESPFLVQSLMIDEDFNNDKYA